MLRNEWFQVSKLLQLEKAIRNTVYDSEILRYNAPITWGIKYRYRRLHSGIANDLSVAQYKNIQRLKENDDFCRHAIEEGQFALFNYREPLMVRNDQGSLFLTKARYADVKKFIQSDIDATFNCVLLGLIDNRPYFAIDISQSATNTSNDIDQVEKQLSAKFYNNRRVLISITRQDASYFFKANSLLSFNKTTTFCSNCGQRTNRNVAGNKRICSKCRLSHYPKISPVVAPLVIRNGNCLLARQSIFPRGLYSVLAGFCESGESLEECVRREVAEEIGLIPTTVQFSTTQGWSFGDTSLMIGCYVNVDSSSEIEIDSELDDAKWFTVDQIRQLIKSCPKPADIGGTTIYIPPPIAIANQILSDWVQGAAS